MDSRWFFRELFRDNYRVGTNPNCPQLFGV